MSHFLYSSHGELVTWMAELYGYSVSSTRSPVAESMPRRELLAEWMKRKGNLSGKNGIQILKRELLVRRGSRQIRAFARVTKIELEPQLIINAKHIPTL